MPDPFISFLPVVAEDVDSVRARFNADANAGLDPNDTAFNDLTEGGFFWDVTQPAAVECVRLWDFLGTEMVAAMFPGTAWGDYLDLHGETIGLPRDDEVQATGVAYFSGPVGTLVPAGTQVATVQADPSSTVPPVVFATDVSIILAATPGPANLATSVSSAGGALPAGTYFYAVTAMVPNPNIGPGQPPMIETVISNEVQVLVSGTTSEVTLTWSPVTGATGYRIYRGQTLGAETLLASPSGTSATYIDAGAAVPVATPAPTNSVAVTAVEAGAAGNVPTGTITQVLSPISGGPSVTNQQPTSGGADVESDDRYRLRILSDYASASGAGNAADYVRWSLTIPQVGNVTVQPLWNGAGTVRVIISDQNNQPNSPAIVAQLQAYLDPVPGKGSGVAPVGAIVTVATPTLLTVTVAATTTQASGYSLDGAAGTIATRAAITAAISGYINALPSGATVVLNKVIGQIMSVPGIVDVSAVTLDGVAGNVTAGALQVPTTGTVTLV